MGQNIWVFFSVRTVEMFLLWQSQDESQIQFLLLSKIVPAYTASSVTSSLTS